ncbi:MAG: hypothetical protein ACYDD1_10170 [Caulobacteraceae bacterium]
MARTEQAMRARRTVVERPQLWSVRAVGQAGQLNTICTNRDIRAGFILPAPTLGAQTCRRLGDRVRTAHGWAFRCVIGADTYAVSSAAIGDLTRAFDTRLTITPLQGRSPGYEQTLRYRRLGPCPAGWEIGQASSGQGVQSAITPADDAPPP